MLTVYSSSQNEFMLEQNRVFITETRNAVESFKDNTKENPMQKELLTCLENSVKHATMTARYMKVLVGLYCGQKMLNTNQAMVIFDQQERLKNIIG